MCYNKVVRKPVVGVELKAGVLFLHLGTISKWIWKLYNWTYLLDYDGILTWASSHILTKSLRNVEVVIAQAMCRFLGENESVRLTVGIIGDYHVASICGICNTSNVQYVSHPPPLV